MDTASASMEKTLKVWTFQLNASIIFPPIILLAISVAHIIVIL